MVSGETGAGLCCAEFEAPESSLRLWGGVVGHISGVRGVVQVEGMHLDVTGA